MPAPGFQLLTDLPNFLKVFPKEVIRATVDGQQEGVTTWRDRPVFPGLAFRFTWPASKPYGFSMRREKYGSPTALRIHYAKQGLGMPREARPGSGRKGLSHGANAAPNITKPWYFTTGGTKAKLLAKRPRSTVSGGTVITRYRASGWGINLLGGQNHRGVTSATWVHVPVTYPMTVYKDAVNRAGAYKVTVTRAIPRWIFTYAARTYRQEFEDLSQDLPFIQRVAEAAVRRNIRDIIIDSRGRVRLRYRRGFSAAGLDSSELVSIQQGAA